MPSLTHFRNISLLISPFSASSWWTPHNVIRLSSASLKSHAFVSGAIWWTDNPLDVIRLSVPLRLCQQATHRLLSRALISCRLLSHSFEFRNALIFLSPTHTHFGLRGHIKPFAWICPQYWHAFSILAPLKTLPPTIRWAAYKIRRLEMNHRNNQC